MAMHVLTLLLCAAALPSGKAPEPEEGSYYTYDQLGVKKAELVGAKINMVFEPEAEQFYWCPGVTVQETPKAVIVTFVRCETSKSCAVDVKARIGKRLVRTVSLDTRGKNTYVRIGPKKFKQIHSVKASKDGKGKTVQQAKPVTKGKPGRATEPPKTGWLENPLVQP